VIDDLEVRIDEEAIRYISLRSPIATELRVIVTAMKASQNFERAADEITKIARRVRQLSHEPPLVVGVDILHMGEIAAGMLGEALDCFISASEEKALAVCHRDAEVDGLNRRLCEELTQLMTRKPETVARAIDLVFVSKALERVADHATNIAEETIYLFQGKDVRHRPDLKQATGAEAG
jgi:phosphate transport system protein